MKVILRVDNDDDLILALRAAKALVRDGHEDCVYEYENGVGIYVKRNPSGSITSRSCYRAGTKEPERGS